MIDLNFKYDRLTKFILKEIPYKPDLAIILGSGLGRFTGNLNSIKRISTKDIPGYPSSTVAGHSGFIHLAESANKKILLFEGRIHFYEGYKLSECILPVFISNKLGCKKILLTNAAGGVNKNLSPGDLMLSNSFNSIFIKKELTELIGITSVERKNFFLDCPSLSFNELIKNSALKEEIEIKEGVYWYNKGPAYETPAEIKMIGKFGGDAVGMSTVHEAVLASFLGMKVSVISCITNMASGISQQKLSHTEVTETAEKSGEKFNKLIKRIIRDI